MTHKILIADDEPHIVVSLEYLLQRAGYEVTVARDGDAAFQAIEQQRPDLVLLDVMMPRRSGFDICASVRGNDGLAKTRILMLTAKGRETDVAKGMALGADDYMTKPFSTTELMERIASLLSR